MNIKIDGVDLETLRSQQPDNPTTVEEVPDAEEVVESKTVEEPNGTPEGTPDEPNEEPDTVVVSIGDEEPPKEDEEPEENAAPWLKKLRKSYRELTRENKELKAKLNTSSTTPQVEVLGPKPTLEESGWDEEDHEAKLLAWYDKKKLIEAQKAKQDEQARADENAWKERLDTYATGKTSLKVDDFDEAEFVAQETLNNTQRGIIIQGAENSALLMYAIGKNPKKAAELAAITDPVKYAFAVAKLESQLKVTNRKAPPPPEKQVKSGAPSSGSGSTYQDLLNEAERTNDYSKVIAYRRQKANKR